MKLKIKKKSFVFHFRRIGVEIQLHWTLVWGALRFTEVDCFFMDYRSWLRDL